MRGPLYFGLLLLLFVNMSCQSDTSADSEPAEIVKVYQQHLDHNEFEKAMALSTPAGASFLRELSVLVEMQDPDSTLLKTVLSDIDCSIEVDTAYCYCKAEDQYETYYTEYRLVRMQNRWLVDAPEDDFTIDTDELMRELLDSLPDME